jgi:hypothetical protein
MSHNSFYCANILLSVVGYESLTLVRICLKIQMFTNIFIGGCSTNSQQYTMHAGKQYLSHIPFHCDKPQNTSSNI